jgi:hypothetical protein
MSGTDGRRRGCWRCPRPPHVCVATCVHMYICRGCYSERWTVQWGDKRCIEGTWSRSVTAIVHLACILDCWMYVSTYDYLSIYVRMYIQYVPPGLSAIHVHPSHVSSPKKPAHPSALAAHQAFVPPTLSSKHASPIPAPRPETQRTIMRPLRSPTPAPSIHQPRIAFEP